jgi:osmotically-inducible protein OsmY
MKTTGQVSFAIASSILLFVFGCQTTRSEATVQIPMIENSQDKALSRSVRERLVNTSKLNLGKVDVISSDGTVYLTGTVTSLDFREQAAKIAWNTPGVQTVVNTLQVQNNPAPVEK